MNVATSRSLPPCGLHRDLRGFELTFIADGKTWKALVRASSIAAAAEEGVITLASKYPDFNADTARLMAVIETR